MILTPAEAKEHIKYRTSQGKTLPTDEVLASMMNEALYHICTNSIPQTLLRVELGKGEFPLRLLDKNKFIIIPRYPTVDSNNKEHIQIDEELVFAVIYYVAHLIDRTPDTLQKANDIISVYNSNYSEEIYG